MLPTIYYKIVGNMVHNYFKKTVVLILEHLPYHYNFVEQYEYQHHLLLQEVYCLVISGFGGGLKSAKSLSSPPFYDTFKLVL